MSTKKNKWLTLVLLTLTSPLQGQDVEQQFFLAEQYFTANEWDKAEIILDKLAKKDNYIMQIHSIYFKTLIALNKTKKAEKYLKKVLRRFPTVPQYKIDYGKLLSILGKTQRANNYYKDYLNTIAHEPQILQKAALVFLEESLFVYAEKAYQHAQKHNPFDYFDTLADLYFKWGKKSKMITQYLNWLGDNAEALEQVQIHLQDRLIEDDEFLLFEKAITKKIQFSPNKIVFNELFLWYLLQRKMFYKAFIQAKAIDRRKQMAGSKVLEIGKQAFDNKGYSEAINIFEYLVDKYKKSPVYFRARNLLVNAKEEQIKNSYPVDIQQIKSLVKDYNQIIDDLGITTSTALSIKRMAMLYAFYLNNKDIAIATLKKVIAKRGMPRTTISDIKLTLGDIYIFNEEPWEASLLYSQVEKAQKNAHIGHLAKLKKAKVWYYKGEFELAKAQLNILKLATSREIANDAMDLALLIDENVNLDTTDAAMRCYAAIDLLVFQGQYTESLRQYESMLVRFKGHSLIDEVLWQKAQLLIKTGQFEQAVQTLKTILSDYRRDIWGDDANYTIAYIYENYLQDKKQAMEFYQKQLVNYKGSVYNTEARKRFRKLRGDKLN